MKKGFTLIELSIVLVIIGLLIGGILVAQSLIDSAKLNSLIRQFAQYDSGANSFKSKYRNLPGDSGIAFPKATSGILGQTALKEGLLTDENTQNNSARYEDTGSAEYLLFWLELARLSSLTPDNCPELATRTDIYAGGRGIRFAGDNCNVASTGFGQSESSIIAAAYDINSPSTSPASYITTSHAPYNSYYIADCSNLNGSGTQFYICEPTLEKIQALAIDAKLDDGAANEGKVTSFDDTSWENLRINDKNLLPNYTDNPDDLVSITVKMEAY